MKILLALFMVCSMILFISCNQDDGSLNDNSVNLNPKNGRISDCNKITDRNIYSSAGELILPGYMDNGYNYQAHMYNGEYDPGWKLVMKWNDAWLSNKDCDGDGLLDRPYDEDGNQYYYGSGAWLTNHWKTTYINDNGEECVYDEFIKIVAVPIDAYKEDGYFYTADGVEIGEVIWGQFAIVQYVVNDPCEGIEGVQYISPDHPGLGTFSD